jgi:hypothetical protein
MLLNPAQLKSLERIPVASPRPVPSPRRRKPVSSPNRDVILMPCGDWAVPAEIMHVFGDAISSFICDRHGEVKVTKKWLKESKERVTAYRLTRIPSEFGYQVTMTETSP